MSQSTRTAAQAGAILDLFPESAEVSPAGRLRVGGVDLADLAAQFGTPAYVMDVDGFRRQAARLRDGLAERWPQSEVLFASKSYPAVGMYRLAAECGLSIDVAGTGEIVMALAGGVEPSRLYFHGNAKTDAELDLALEAGVGTIVIDNQDELYRLERLFTRPQAVMVRVLPGIDADTHPSNATGGNDSKFGLPADQALALIGRIRANPRLDLRGVHVHIGSQILDVEPFKQAVLAISTLGVYPVYDIGGGLGVRYTQADRAPSVEAYLDAVVSVAREVLPHDSRLLIEPGRSLAARAGICLYRVVSVKRTGRTFVAVDGGMADNLDIALTGQRHEATIVTKVGEPPTVVCDLVGRQCESGDRLIEHALLPDPQVGDYVAVSVNGAYAYTFANNYNGALKPPIVMVEGGRAWLAARRETYADLLATQTELDPEGLARVAAARSS